MMAARLLARAAVALLAVLAVATLLAPPASGETRVLFAGSGTNLPITRGLADAFRKKQPGLLIEVPASIGSGGGIRAVADGAIAVGLASRPLKDEERALGLTAVTYARTAVVLGVHPSVAEDNITFEELVQIYRGVRRQWRDGKDIIVLTREPGDSSIELLEAHAPGFHSAYRESQRARRWMTLRTDQEANRALARMPYALGLSDMGAIVTERLPIKALKVNGVAPSLQNVRAGRYPLIKRLFFVFLEDRLPPAARTFIDFARSKEGEAILLASGYLPAE